ncbi:DUF1501 domain-containing protein [Pelagibacterales bacterium SAG-MED16]|nr:DUF1501 domain-containing protein [Pelagibacterales bacterium SAG-MED16]
MKISRRNFLKGSATTLFLAGFNFPVLANSEKKKNLVVIMLRGGMDGLCAVPIIGDKNFEKRRKDLILDETIKLNSDFALHPKLKNFYNLWQNNLGTIIHATNIPYTKRSHFDGQNLMETGGHIPYSIKTGWLGRGMKLADLKGDGLALALPMPLLLRGIPSNDNFYPSKKRLPRTELLQLLKSVYTDKSEHDLANMMEIIANRSMMNNGGTSMSRKNSSLAYKAGLELKKINGPRVAVFEVDGFDTHAAQGGVNGSHSDSLIEMDSIFKSLEKGLGSEIENTLVLTLTEFGRTIKQNGGRGTEHGYGSAIFMAGGLLKKSQVYTDWPGLKRKELFEGRDLNSTIDARSVYASAMSTVFDLDFKRIQKEVFWGDDLQNLSDKLFKA